MNSFVRSKELLGTSVSIEIIHQDAALAEQKLAEAFAEIARIEKAFSRFLETSELSLLNRRLHTWVQVSEELFYLIQSGLTLHKMSDGAFDLTVHSILDNLGYDQNYSFHKKKDEAKLGKVEVKITKQESQKGQKEKNYFIKTSAPLDLGGLGKGYALDQAKKILDSLENFCIDAGGDLYVKGHDANHKPWRVAFEHPLDPQKAFGYIESSNLFLASSNPIKRSWGEDHHLIDPKFLKPAQKMLAVYTQGTSGLLVDGWATALFALGFEKAQHLLPALPVEAMIISKEGGIVRSKNFQGELFLKS